MVDSLGALPEHQREVGDTLIGCPKQDLNKSLWLTEGNGIYNYECPECKQIHSIEISRRVPNQFIKDYKHPCTCTENGSTVCIYRGSEPRSINIMTKMTFEKNGRKGIRTTFADGSSSTRSQTKENALNGKKNLNSVLTKGHQEAVDKATQTAVIQKERMLGNELKKLSADRRKK